MNYLENNLKLLQGFSSRLYNKASVSLEKEPRESRFSICMAKNGEPTLQYQIDGKQRFLTSSYNPSREGVQWAETVEEKKAYIIYGMGIGYHLKALAEREDVERILVIEPELEIFMLALRHQDMEWCFTNPKFIILVEEDEEVLKWGIKIVICNVYNEFIFESFGNYGKIFNEDFEVFHHYLNETVGEYVLEINTLAFFGRTWTENFFANLYPTLTNPGVKGLFDKFKDVPAVIISAGPSLNKNIHLLKELKGKAVLLCVGTSYKALKKHGIVPDLILSFDGSDKNYEIFAGAEIADIPLVYDPTINCRIIEEYNGPLIPANVSRSFIDWFEEKLEQPLGNLLLGGSIANVTFDMARKIGANPIIFVGQDLAYTGGETHAQGTIYEKDRVKSSGTLMEVFVEDIYGNQVLSNRSFVLFRQWFEKQIQLTPDRLFIDATEGGAKIQGTEIMTLAEVIEKHCQKSYPIAEVIRQHIEDASIPKREIVAKGRELLKEIRTEVHQFNKRAQKGLRCVEELQELFKRPEVNHKRIGKNLRALDQIDKKILSYEDGKVFLQMIFQPLVVPLLNGPDAKPQPNETEAESHSRILRHNRNLYDGFYEMSKIVLEIIEKTGAVFEEREHEFEEGVEKC